ncbi:hypothetical protein D9757_011830 [Collybiopsis confluens]|uniref:Uncharacterized protein n=1 Tax=Collybiopsis confluens TaxID=2823264 RepID=A0A8H5H0L9_9AGAR|nr:hypothetical protein D9757_011830 [Collybiopsis confluens]
MSLVYLPSSLQDATDLYKLIERFPQAASYPSFFDKPAFSTISSFKPPTLLSSFGLTGWLPHFPSTTYPEDLTPWYSFKYGTRSSERTYRDAEDAYFSVLAIQNIFKGFVENHSSLNKSEISQQLPRLFSQARRCLTYLAGVWFGYQNCPSFVASILFAVQVLLEDSPLDRDEIIRISMGWRISWAELQALKDKHGPIIERPFDTPPLIPFDPSSREGALIILIYGDTVDKLKVIPNQPSISLLPPDPLATETTDKQPNVETALLTGATTSSISERFSSPVTYFSSPDVQRSKLDAEIGSPGPDLTSIKITVTVRNCNQSGENQD